MGRRNRLRKRKRSDGIVKEKKARKNKSNRRRKRRGIVERKGKEKWVEKEEEEVIGEKSEE